MPQPKSSRSAKSSARTPAARKPAAAKGAGSGPRSSSARKPAASTRKAAASAGHKPAAASRKAAASAGRKPAAGTRKPASSRRRPASAARSAARAPSATTGGEDALRQNLQAVRELLSEGVVLTAQRIQEALDDAVQRGRMTRRDAEDLAKGLVDAGRRQTQDLLADVEQLLGRSRTEVVTRAGSSGDRVLREVDRVRRGAGVGPSFPILGYDDLSAGQIGARLGDLKPAELRKVRDYERRNANRKSVLNGIEKRLR